MAGNSRKLILVILSFLHIASGARILGVFPHSSHSHQRVFRALTMELLKRGHELVVFTTHPLKDPSIKNLTEIDFNFLSKEYSKFDFYTLGKQGLFRFLYPSYKFNVKSTDTVLSHPLMQRIISPNSTEKFDLIFVQYLYYDSLYALPIRLNAPMIGISSLPLMGIHHYMLGNPVAVAYVPSPFLGYSDDMNFWCRIVNLYYYVRQVYEYLTISIPMHDEVLRKHFGENMPSIHELSRNVSLFFVNERLFFNYPRPNLPSIISIGGLRSTNNKKSLPEDLKKILDNANPGFIYFSLGSNLKSEQLPVQIQNVILETFAELPYTVLWKFGSEEPMNKSHNVHIRKWFPQDDILGHPKIVLFMYQGGLQSTEEAVDNGVPVIGFPVFSDQMFNVNRMQNLGLGKMMNLMQLTKETLKDSILEVITNSRYKENAMKLRDTFNDLPYHPMDHAVWWTEHTIRHKGVPLLRNKSRDMPLYQIYLLDILAFFLIVCAVLLYCSFIVLRHIFRRTARSVRQPTPPAELNLKKRE